MVTDRLRITRCTTERSSQAESWSQFEPQEDFPIGGTPSLSVQLLTTKPTIQGFAWDDLADTDRQ
jgi:hypothetical protein